MDTKIKEIRELKRMQEELAAELDALVDEVKRYMDAEGVDTISGTDWKVTYKAVTSARFGSTIWPRRSRKQPQASVSALHEEGGI